MREGFEESFTELEKERREAKLTLSKPQLWDCSFTSIPFTQLLSTDNNSQYFCMIIMCQALGLAFNAHYCMESSQPPPFIQQISTGPLL